MQQKTSIYIRVSTHWQVDRDSLQVQRRDLIAYSELVLGISDYEIFEDPGYSAKNTDRPAYQQMISRLRTGEFSHLLVWKIDRISRNLIDFAEMYAELKSLGVVFVSKNEQFDTSSAMGEAMLKIILVFAELERKMIGERVTAVMMSRATEGKWNGGFPTYGYKLENGTILINEEESNTVRYMVSLCLQGKTLTQIVTDLNEHGFSNDGKPWARYYVHRILQSDFYTGSYTYNVHAQTKGRKPKSEWIVVKNHHDAIISEEDHEAVKEILSRNQRGKDKPGDTYTKKHTHIFAGLVRCELCGANFTAQREHTRKYIDAPTSAYLCSNRKESTIKCPNQMLSDVVLIPFVLTLIGNVLTAQKTVVKNTSVSQLKMKLLQSIDADDIDDEDVKTLLTAMKQNRDKKNYFPVPQQYDNTRNELIAQRSKKELALNRLHQLYLYGETAISESSYVAEKESIQKEIKELDELIQKSPQPTTSEDTLATFAIMLKFISEKIELSEFLKKVPPSVPKDFLNSIIDHINVLNRKITKVTFKNGITLHFKHNGPL